jgi:protoheme IX farnesyltransferase
MKDEAVEVSATHTPTRSSDFFALTKPRLNFLVVATATAGYYMGVGPETSLATLFHAVSGTAFVAAGSAVFNMVLERRVDRLMKRTRLRPLADGRVEAHEAIWFGVALSIIGLVQLAVGANLLAAGVALVTLATYIFWYTPSKLRTSFSTVIGAIPGALPPMIGWAAATNRLSIEAWLLFGIVFLWQMPHFLAIAWLYREDYARAGFPLLPVIEPDGLSTARQATAYASALLPVSLTPTLVGLTSEVYFVGALLSSCAMLFLTWRFARERSGRNARWLFFGSIIYLPVLWVLMVITRIPR